MPYRPIKITIISYHHTVYFYICLKTIIMRDTFMRGNIFILLCHHHHHRHIREPLLCHWTLDILHILRFHFLCLALECILFISLLFNFFFYFQLETVSTEYETGWCFKEVLWSRQKEGNSYYCITTTRCVVSSERYVFPFFNYILHAICIYSGLSSTIWC